MPTTKNATIRYHALDRNQSLNNYNEHFTANFLADIVINCKTNPELFRIQNPALNLKFELKTKGIQYFLPMTEWNTKFLK